MTVKELELKVQNILEAFTQFMANTNQSIDELSQRILLLERQQEMKEEKTVEVPKPEVKTAKELLDEEPSYDLIMKELATATNLLEKDIEPLVLAKRKKLNNIITMEAALRLVVKDLEKELPCLAPPKVALDPKLFNPAGIPYCSICKTSAGEYNTLEVRLAKSGKYWWACKEYKKHPEGSGFPFVTKPGQEEDGKWWPSEADFKKYGKPLKDYERFG